MNKDELKSILEQHRLWIEGNGGKRADLQYANLQCADLQCADSDIERIVCQKR